MKKICYVATVAVTVKSFFIEQMKYLSENGFDVTVICSPDENLEDVLPDAIRYIPVNITRGVSPLNVCKSIFTLYKIFKKKAFELVQFTTPNAAFVASIASYLAGIKIRNYHLMGLRYIGLSGIARIVFKFLEKLTCKLSTDIECVSESMRQICISDKLFSEEKSVVIWNGSTGGVNLERFDYKKRNEWRIEIREGLKLNDNEFVFGFVGRITRDKGINELFNAFLSSNLPAKLIIIGIPEGIETLDPVLYERAKENSNIIFLDYTTEIEKYYAAIDVLILPSYREGFGMVIAEAAAMGTPSIISDIPGPIDVVIPGKTALLCKVKDADDLRKKMKQFYENKDKLPIFRNLCVNHIKNKFDSQKLNTKILERKNKLISKYLNSN